MHLRLKKSLGQNFLKDKNMLDKISRSCNLNLSDTVVEIGSGSGLLTELLIKKVKFLYAIEIDKKFYQLLNEKFLSADNIEIINADVLKTDFSRFFTAEKKIQVIGNIPYYITTPIIEHLLGYSKNIERIFLTVQKEFAERVVSPPGSKQYGSLSCFLQYYTIPEMLFTINRKCFSPVPKVDSALLRLTLRDKSPVALNNEEWFFQIIRAAFNKRRKTLRNSLEGLVDKKTLENFFENSKMNPNIRPEQLSLPDFAALANSVSKQLS